ncbi:MAG TPA: PfkB family carbohydrate kinase, partial [Myxococcota bacterium]|nr:PfkB family carbohydrate kinase [Myxococcota bacterium]
MILTVTANAAIDRTLCVEELSPGCLHSAASDHVQAGGKGVNVARVLHAFGVPVHALVLVGGEAGDWIVKDLERAQIPCSAVRASGESRTCLALLETKSGRATQVHGAGVTADAAVARDLIAHTAELARSAGWVALCGSLAQGLPAESAGALVRAARGAGARVAVDTSGGALRSAGSQGPELLRVNRDELAGVLGVARHQVPAPPYPTLGPIAMGVISDGAFPIEAWCLGGGRWQVAPPHVSAKNTVGCGDAMLAGLLKTLSEGRPFDVALLAATGLAAAQAESRYAGVVDPVRARSLAHTLGAAGGLEN